MLSFRNLSYANAMLRHAIFSLTRPPRRVKAWPLYEGICVQCLFQGHKRSIAKLENRNAKCKGKRKATVWLSQHFMPTLRHLGKHLPSWWPGLTEDA